MDSDSSSLVETVLAPAHRALGARMVPFAGWLMPVQYDSGILAEHSHTRTQVSLFDICHMGEFRVVGTGSAQLLDSALARSVADQKIGVCRYNFLLNEQGGVLDDLIVYRIADDQFYIVVNAGTRHNDAAVLRQRLGSSVVFTDESDDTAKLDLQGPAAADVLARFGINSESLPAYYHFSFSQIGGVKCILSRTGYTGELGFELYFPASNAEQIWNLLLSDPQVNPAGLGARDTLRLEMGYPLYGHEMNPETTPVEAGFGAMLKLDSSSRKFVGSDALRSVPPKKHLVGLKLDGRRAARAGDIVSYQGQRIGIVTSGAFGPSIGAAVAMAFLDSNAVFPANAKLDIALQRGSASASVVDLPFYQNGTARKKL